MNKIKKGKKWYIMDILAVIAFIILITLLLNDLSMIAKTGTRHSQEWRDEAWQQLIDNDYKPIQKGGYTIYYNKYSDDMEIVRNY